MEIREKTAPPPNDNPREFVLSDESVDRMGDVIEAKGWQLDAIKTPPPALYNHNKDVVLGNWYDLRIDRGRLIGRLVWMETDYPIVRYVRELVDQKVLRTVSVGFQPEESEPLDPKQPNRGGRRFKRQQLLECSIVTVPANPNAIAISRSLNIPHDIENLLFRKPATEQGTIDRAFHGKPAAQPLVPQGTKMSISATIATKIQNAQQNVNALLGAYEELAGKLDLTEEETKRYRDELPGQIASARAELESHKQSERILLTNGSGETRTVTTPAAIEGQILAPQPAKTDPAPERVTLPAQPRKQLQFSDHQFRALAAWTKAQAAHDPDLGTTLRNMYQGSNHNEITSMVLRAVANPANTTVATWAAELVQTDTMPFLDRLMADSIYLPLSNAGVRYTFGNAGVLKIPVRAASPAGVRLAGNWVAEGAPKPVRRASFTTVTLAPTKMAVISTFTEEMAQYSPQSIEQIIRQAMSDDTSEALDTYLIDATAASAGIRPAGLLAGVTPITASVLTPAASAMVADLKALVGAIVAAGGGRNIVLLVNPIQAISMGVVTTTTGDFLFDSAQAAAARFNSRVIISSTVPAGRVIAIDAADFATANGDAPRFAVSTDATLHEEDTTPLALAATGSPNVVAAPMRSLFQTDAVAVRMSLYVTWAMRRTGMVQTIASVSW
jgi:HK97 family phage major capsid protein/HK97 family phage prohead protease